MFIVQDSREQAPLAFPVSPALEGVKVEKLDYGDYRARYQDGSSSVAVFDRKSLGDLYGTLTSGYLRFKKELERSLADGARLELIVECPLTKVAEGFERSQFEGRSMMKKLGTLWHKYQLYTVFCKDRAEMAAYILWRFESEGYQRLRGGK